MKVLDQRSLSFVRHSGGEKDEAPPLPLFGRCPSAVGVGQDEPDMKERPSSPEPRHPCAIAGASCLWAP